MSVNSRKNGVDPAVSFISKKKLLLPPIPQSFRSSVEELGSGVFGTAWAKGRSLYNVQAFMNEAMNNANARFFVFGQAGHGINSWAMHYYLVDGPIALFLQLPYGGAYMSREASIGAITGAWGLIKDLIRAADEAEVATEERLYIVESPLSASRWAWGKRGEVLPSSVWQIKQPTFYNALCSIILGRVA